MAKKEMYESKRNAGVFVELVRIDTKRQEAIVKTADGKINSFTISTWKRWWKKATVDVDTDVQDDSVKPDANKPDDSTKKSNKANKATNKKAKSDANTNKVKVDIAPLLDSTFKDVDGIEIVAMPNKANGYKLKYNGKVLFEIYNQVRCNRVKLFTRKDIYEAIKFTKPVGLNVNDRFAMTHFFIVTYDIFDIILNDIKVSLV